MEKFRRLFKKHKTRVTFKLGQTLRQRIIHPKDKTRRHKLRNVAYAVQCSDLYIGETKQSLHSNMAQHRRATSSGQDSLFICILRRKVTPLWTEDGWFERSKRSHLCPSGETLSKQRWWTETPFFCSLHCCLGSPPQAA